MIEHFFQCPYCWEEISMLLEKSDLTQSYIEDCEVCCQPIQIALSYVVNLEISAYPLVGPRNFFELDSCIDATNIELSTEELRYLETGN